MKKLLPALAVLFALAPLRDAGACHNTVIPKVDPATARVIEAERLVDAGNPKDAAKWVREANPQFEKRDVGATPLSDRALSVLARAAVRTEGAVFFGHQGEPDAEAKSRAVGWSVDTLRGLHEKHKGEPVYTAYLGEALAAQPSTRAEAERVLGDLAKRDVLASPHAYAALARVYASRAEGQPGAVGGPLTALTDARRALALHRCERMAKDKGICAGTPEAPAKPSHGLMKAVARENEIRDRYNREVIGDGRHPTQRIGF